MPHFKGKALTFWRPWDLAVVFYGKNVENRKWPTEYRGPLAIHAGKHWDTQGERFIRKTIGSSDKLYLRRRSIAGSIIGICELYACFAYAGPDMRPQVICGDMHGLGMNKWAFGPYCWLLRDIRPIVPVPMRGRRGLWLVDFEYELLRRA